MKTHFLLIILFILPISSIYSQPKYSLLGEGSETHVKLFFISSYWPSDLEGFVLKKQLEDGEWIKLNNSPIIPGTSTKKDLSNISSDKEFISKLIQIRTDLISDKKLKVIESDAMKTAMENPETVKMLSVMLNRDYNIALISGFAYLDKTDKKATYGLFPILKGEISKEPAASYIWDKNILSPKIEVSSTYMVNKSNNTLQLIWKIKTKDYEKYPTLNGFNIYEKGNPIALNPYPQWINLQEEYARCMIQVPLPSEHKEFYVSPISIFNTEHNKYYLKVEISSVSSKIPTLDSKKLSSNIIKLHWDKFNEPIEIQKRTGNGEFLRIKTISDTTRNSFIDTLHTIGSYHYRLFIPSSQKSTARVIVHINSIPNTQSAQEVQCIAKEDGISLTWTGSDNVSGYYLYTDKGYTDIGLAHYSIAGLIQSNSYFYKVYGSMGKAIQFAISPVDSLGTEGKTSPPCKVIFPSSYLSSPSSLDYTLNNNQITLNWTYDDDYIDLKGFDVIMNGEVIKETIHKTWQSEILASGIYQLSIRAYSLSGVESSESNILRVKIE